MAIEHLTNPNRSIKASDVLKVLVGCNVAFVILRITGSQGANDHLFIGNENETPAELLRELKKMHISSIEIAKGTFTPKRDVQQGEGMHLFVDNEVPFEKVERHLSRIGTPHPRA